MMQFNPMNFGSYSAWGSVGLHIHCLFGALLLLGLVAAIIWMAKYASKKQVKNIAIWTIIIGAIGMLLTAPLAFRGFQSMFSQHMPMWQYGQLSEEGQENMQDFYSEMWEHMGLDQDTATE